MDRIMTWETFANREVIGICFCISATTLSSLSNTFIFFDACRTIILFNPEVRGLKSGQEVDLLREKVYAALEEYTRTTKPDEPGRFAKLLLRLPPLRSIGLKCLEHLFFFRLIGDMPIDAFLTEMLESSPRLLEDS